MKLSEKKCAACEGLKSQLSSEEVENMLGQTPGWELLGTTIQRIYRFPNFVEAMSFANRITKVAEEENHHPNLHISWGKVRVELSTHSIGGLSINDFIVAAKINRVWDESEQKQAI